MTTPIYSLESFRELMQLTPPKHKRQAVQHFLIVSEVQTVAHAAHLLEKRAKRLVKTAREVSDAS